MEIIKICTKNMDVPRTKEEWEEYKKMQHESIKTYINENGDIKCKITLYS